MMITSHEGKQGDGSHKTIIGQPGSSSSAWKWMDPMPLGGCLALGGCMQGIKGRSRNNLHT